MNSPTFPAEIVAVILAEALFGLGFNKLVSWAHLHKLWDVSISVVIGVSVTVLIPTVIWWRISLDFWLAAALLAACFASSGTPMIIGSMQRSAAETHKRRPWPTAAAKARDDSLMELSAIAQEISTKTKRGDIKVQDMADVVNRIHQVIGFLKSV